MSTITSLDPGSTANDGTGTPLRSGSTIINDNFTNLNTDKIEAATTDTLTNKSVDLSTNTLTGTTAEFNTALSDGSFATGGGTATGTNTGDQTTVTGNAGTATALETARTINTVSFDGTANISVPSDITAGTSGNLLTSNGSIWTSAAPASSGHTIEDEGTPLTTREALNFIGAGVTVTDNAGTDASDVTLNSPASDPSGVTGADAVTNIMSLTQAEYDAIGTPDASTIYNITDGTASMTASSTDTMTNKTFDANGTGNSLSNVDVADLANGTDGELITWDAAGAPAVVAVGTATHVLTSNGAGVAPTFQAAGGGGGSTIMFQRANNVGSGTTYYNNHTNSGTIDILSMSVQAGTLQNLVVEASVNSMTGGTGTTFTIMKNGVASALTLTVANGVTGVNTDAVNTVTVALGDRIELRRISDHTGGSLTSYGNSVQLV